MGFFEDLQKILVDFETSIMAEVKEEIAAEFAIMEEKPSSEYVVPYMNVQNINGTLKDMDGKLLSAGKFANRTLSQLKAEILKDVALPETGIVDIFKDGSALALYQFDGNSGDAEIKGDESEYINGKFGSAINDSSCALVSFENKTITNTTISFWVKKEGTLTFSNSWNGFIKAGTTWSDNADANGSRNLCGFFLNETNGTNDHLEICGTRLDNCFEITEDYKHIVIKIDSSIVSIYENGVNVGSNEFTLEVDELNYLSVGDASLHHKGSGIFLDQVRVFNKALSEEEILRLFNESDVLQQSNFEVIKGISMIPFMNILSPDEDLTSMDAFKIEDYSIINEQLTYMAIIAYADDGSTLGRFYNVTGTIQDGISSTDVSNCGSVERDWDTWIRFRMSKTESDINSWMECDCSNDDGCTPNKIGEYYTALADYVGCRGNDGQFLLGAQADGNCSIGSANVNNLNDYNIIKTTIFVA